METNQIYDIFDVGGLLDSNLKYYEFREGQLDMSLLIAQTYTNGGVSAIEAGTGIGKSYAYLVPALLHAQENSKERTVIATNTINLQKQLFDKDLTQLENILESGVKSALLMGRSNYLCIRRVQELIKDNSKEAEDINSEIGSLVAWAKKTTTGLRSDYKGYCSAHLWSQVNSDPDFCYGFRCPYNQECFYYNARRKAHDSQIIITNHHLLFTDLAYRQKENLSYDVEGVLPPFQNLIVDEAHNIERNATAFFSSTYNTSYLKSVVDKTIKTQRGKRSLLNQLLSHIDENVIEQLNERFNQLITFNQDIETYLFTFLNDIKDKSVLIEAHHKSFLDDLELLALPFIKGSLSLYSLVESALEKGDFDEESENLARQLHSYTKELVSLGNSLNLFLEYGSSEDVRWVEHHKGRKENSVTLHTTKLTVGEDLNNNLYAKLRTIIFTSATLDLKDDFNYWASRVGLINQSFSKGVFNSQFDFQNKLMLLTPLDAPVFTEKDSEPFINYCSDTIYKSTLSSSGGALLLFTSYAMLVQVYNLLEEKLKKENFTLLKQGDEDRFTLLEKFKEDKDSILFATDSFWEGVDIPGESLRVVVITKLPFKVPFDPVFRARMESLDKEGKGGFFALALPEATMRLKQGFGRLLRNKLDKGIVLILDSRVVSKGYGRFMLNALPPSFHPETTTDRIDQKIEDFLFI